MSTRDIEAHLLEVYGVSASRELISNVTEVATDEIEIWRNRPGDEVYPIGYVDGIRIKVRDKCAACRHCWRARRTGSGMPGCKSTPSGRRTQPR